MLRLWDCTTLEYSIMAKSAKVKATRISKAVKQALEQQGVDASAVSKAAEQAATNEVKRQVKVAASKAAADKLRKADPTASAVLVAEQAGIDISALAKSKAQAKAEFDKLSKLADDDAKLMLTTSEAVQKADQQRLQRMLERGKALRQPNASVITDESTGILGLTMRQQVYVDLLTRELHKARDGKFNSDGKPLKLDASTRVIKSNCAAIIAGCQLGGGKITVELRETDSKGKEKTVEKTLTIDDYAKFVMSPPTNLVRSGQSSMFQRAAQWARQIRLSHGLKSSKGNGKGAKLLDAGKVIRKLEAAFKGERFHGTGLIALLQWGAATAARDVPEGNTKVYANAMREWLHNVDRVFREVDAKSKPSDVDTHEETGINQSVIDMMPEALKRRIVEITEQRKADEKVAGRKRKTA
jgi:hypothetical protein